GVISQMGNWFNYIAIFVLLTKLTGSGHAVSWFLIAKFLPSAVLGPAAGVLVDRLPRKAIMIASDLVRAGIVLCFLLVSRPDQVWIVYVLALTQESIWTFFDPARRASIPNLCAPHELNVANALGGASWSVMLALGAALGGLTSAVAGWQAAIVIDALTFLISAWLLSAIHLPPPPPSPPRKLTWQDYTGLADLREGCRYVASDRQVAALLLVKSGWALSGGIFVLLTVFGEQVFPIHNAGGGSGILYSCRGIGAAIGPILAWRFLGEERSAMYRAIGLSFFVASAAYLLFSQAPTLLAAAPLVLLGHMGGSVQWVFSTNLLQRRVPDQFRGRVFAAEMALLTLILSLSTYFTGAALDTGTSPRTAMVRLALLFLVPGILWTLYARFDRTSKDIKP
ncbi:MAG: MFS transporter, partial [Desulfobulbaceae bacterium]|nr:MFS transporter [Desulfobulbaceae bacterium]